MVQVIFTGDWSLPVKEAETTMRLSRSSPPIRPRLNSALMVSFPASHDLFCVMMVQSAGNEGRRDSRSCIFKDVKFTSRGSFRLTAHTSTEKCREAGRRARLNNGRPLAEARGVSRSNRASGPRFDEMPSPRAALTTSASHPIAIGPLSHPSQAEGGRAASDVGGLFSPHSDFVSSRPLPPHFRQGAG